MGSPYRPATDEENALFQDLTDNLARRFIDLVVQHRHLSDDQRRQIATARVLLADEAVRLGLVDTIGYLDDAVAKAKEIGGLPQNAKVVAYRRYEPENDTIYNPAILDSGDDFGALSAPYC